MYDIAIVGAGAAGLAAAIYAARAGLNYILLDQDGYGGGQIMSAHEVENYPGVPHTAGADLGEAFRAQAEDLGAEVQFALVEELIPHREYWEIRVEEEEPIRSRAVIVATGAAPRMLGVPGEEEFLGRGVSYCALCDGSFYAKKRVIVVGGGDTAVEDALYLSGICSKVTVILRRSEFRAARRRVEQLEAKENVTILYEAQVKAIRGSRSVERVILDSEMVLDAEGVFIAVGVEPRTACLATLPLTFAEGYVVAGESCATELPGLYVAGDLRKKPLRQVVTAVADGANAVTCAGEWLRDRV